MTLNLISTEQCIDQLQNYASTEVRSWNPFKLFRKEKLKNHNLASDTAKLLGKAYLSNKDLLKIASTIDHFEDSQLQHELLCLLQAKINERQDSFLTKRTNINQITQTLQDLLNRKYNPWWTLFLFEVPFYSYDFRNNVKQLIGNISDLFVTRRTETKQHLIHVYSNEEIVNQIISEYHTSDTGKNTEQQKELAVILDVTLEQTIDHTQKVLIKEIQKKLLTEIPFSQVLISAAVLSGVISSYLSKKDNQTKSKQIQAQEILYIIGTIFLKTNAGLIAKSFIPGVGELVDAVVSVTTSKSKLNPLDTDQKIGKAVASVTGGAIGGAIGTAIPFIGTYIGAYVGAVVSKTAATRFYQVLEAWQKAPRGPQSIIPGYNKAYITLFDNDAKNILNPLYKNYLETEQKSKLLGDEIAKWLCIYTLLQNSSDKPSEEYLEIINEEMNRLKLDFIKLKNNHAKTSLYLFSKKPDNSERVLDYKLKVKECLQPLHQPIIRMLDEYFSPNLKAVSTPSVDSYSLASVVEMNDVHSGSLHFFPKTQSTADSGQTSPNEPRESHYLSVP